jgi:hypothetical protein
VEGTMGKEPTFVTPKKEKGIDVGHLRAILANVPEPLK